MRLSASEGVYFEMHRHNPCACTQTKKSRHPTVLAMETTAQLPQPALVRQISTKFKTPVPMVPEEPVPPPVPPVVQTKPKTAPATTTAVDTDPDQKLSRTKTQLLQVPASAAEVKTADKVQCLSETERKQKEINDAFLHDPFVEAETSTATPATTQTPVTPTTTTTPAAKGLNPSTKRKPDQDSPAVETPTKRQKVAT